MDQHSDPQYKMDDGSALRIWKDAAQNNFLSTREGRPIFDEVVYVEVISPGSGNSTPIFEVLRILAPEANHPEPKYGAKYAEYKKYLDDFEASDRRDASLSGTPLAQWSEITRSMAASMKAQKIFTVDALAALPDSKLHVIGPDGRTWREKAKAYIENAKSASYATTLAADLEIEKLRTADLDAQLQAMADQVRVLQENAVQEDGVKQPPAPAKAEIPPPLVTTELAPII